MKCYIVSVNYADYLIDTLPYNKHHFDEIVIVTSTTDTKTFEIAEHHNCTLYPTDKFYQGGAYFNKWGALQEAIDCFGPSGEMCIMDSDIFIPKNATLEVSCGKLIIPRRRMGERLTPEELWDRLPYDEFIGWAGYCMLFHTSDPTLLRTPWFRSWVHAGGGDTDFERRWRSTYKSRSKFEVLHVGQARTNWCGRSEADQKRLKHIMEERRHGCIQSERMYE